MEFIILHGWGVSPQKMAARWGIGEYFEERGWSVTMPRRGCLNWRRSDVEWVVDVVIRVQRRNPVVLGGFSDGARVALLAAARCRPAGLVFHSGRWRKGDVEELPCRTLIVAGDRDWTARIPLVGTNTLSLWHRFAGHLFRHAGGHEWGVGTNEAIYSEFGSMT